MQSLLEQLTIHFTRADEFIEYLRPSKPHWSVTVRGKLRWIFRGQRDQSWGLTPSAWRKDGATRRAIQELSAFNEDRLVDFECGLDRCRLTVPSRIADANEQSECELRMLQEFIAHVNVAGLPFPHDTVHLNPTALGMLAAAEDYRLDDSCDFRICRGPFFDRVLQAQRLPDLAGLDGEAQANPELRRLADRWPSLTNFTMRHSLPALAQHHGIPTRLLDWSYDARKAAYFAAKGIPESELTGEKRIAVFAANPFMLKNRFIYEDALLPHIADDLSVELFLARHSIFTEKTQTTSFILAQDGLFSHPEYADLHYVFTGKYPDLLGSVEKMDEWRRKYQSNAGMSFPVTDYVRKLTLPYAQVDMLLDMLDDERVMLTTLMPSLDRLKECMLERAARRRRLSNSKSR